MQLCFTTFIDQYFHKHYLFIFACKTYCLRQTCCFLSLNHIHCLMFPKSIDEHSNLSFPASRLQKKVDGRLRDDEAIHYHIL